MNDDGLLPLREVIAAHGLQANKSLGQNFLCDLNLTRRIARSAGDLKGYCIYEVGPGPGGLTRALLMEGAENIIAVEKDKRALAPLLEISEAYKNKLSIENSDALTFNPLDFSNGKPIKIVANLPYNIATLLLIHWLKQGFYTSMTLMFQKEVADRIVAKENDEAYGRLSVLCALLCDSKKQFDIHPSNFVPPPKIWSSVVHFTPKPRPDEILIAKLEKVTEAAFGQRRKMIRQSLKAFNFNFQSLGIEETKRAENLSLDDFIHLAKNS